MIRLLADENMNGPILEGLIARIPELDLIRAVDAGLDGLADPDLLNWAALRGRVLLTHDLRTMPRHLTDRLRTGRHSPGVIIVKQSHGTTLALEELTTVVACGVPDDFRDQVTVIPFDT